LFKKSVQQGRSERRGESYFVPYVEPLSDARTMLVGFFNNLSNIFAAWDQICHIFQPFKPMLFVSTLRFIGKTRKPSP